MVKLFTPDANCTWLITEIDPDDQDIAFGLFDLGWDSLNIGNLCLTELSQLRGRAGLPVESDRHFEADKSLNRYASEALRLQRIKA